MPSAQSDHCAMVVKVTFSPSSHGGKIQSLTFLTHNEIHPFSSVLHDDEIQPSSPFLLGNKIQSSSPSSCNGKIHNSSYSHDKWWWVGDDSTTVIEDFPRKIQRSLKNNKHDFYCCQSIINMIFIVAKTQTRGSSDGGIDGKNCWEFEW